MKNKNEEANIDISKIKLQDAIEHTQESNENMSQEFVDDIKPKEKYEYVECKKGSAKNYIIIALLYVIVIALVVLVVIGFKYQKDTILKFKNKQAGQVDIYEKKDRL